LCGTHGSCAEVILSNGIATVCQCESSYSGCNCETYLGNVCSSNYCQNGGVCGMNGSTPYCQCPQTYTGSQCETIISTMSTTVEPNVTYNTSYPTTTTQSKRTED